VGALTAALPGAPPRAQREILKAVILVGGEPTESLEAVAATVDPRIAMTLYWLRRGIGPAEAAARLAAACDGQQPDAEEARKLADDWRDHPDAPGALYNLLWASGRRLTGFDCKTDTMPADHDELVEEMARIAGGRIDLADPVQAVGPEGEIELSFTLDGTRHAVRLRDLGRYYDIGAMLDGLNAALVEHGHPGRYVQFATGDASAIIAFVNGEAFLEAARDLHIPLDADPDAGRERSIAYTRQVLASAGAC
jgi:hypothetical protein